MKNILFYEYFTLSDLPDEIMHILIQSYSILLLLLSSARPGEYSEYRHFSFLFSGSI